MKKLSNIIFVLAILFITRTVFAECHGKIFNPITDVCWSCIFPITIGSVSMGGGLPDTPNSSEVICVCKHDPFPEPGITVGYWEPMALVEVTRTPGCMVNLGGLTLPVPSVSGHGTVDDVNADNSTSFYYTHYYNMPLMQLLYDSLLNGSCHTDGETFLPSYISETDPTTNNDVLAALAYPEGDLIAATAVLSAAACGIDALAANAGLPSETSFYCAGSQGLFYPLTGTSSGLTTTAARVTLMAERTVFKLHRLGIIEDTKPERQCGTYTTLWLPKSRYRYQLSYPSTAACKPFGRSTDLWASNPYLPTGSDDSSFVIWRKRNCCSY